jgi:hypothetical protein
VTLKEYIQTLPKDRVQLAATDIDEAAKIEQEHSARDDAVFDNADLKTKSENISTDESQNSDSLDVTDEEQNPYSFDIADEGDAKKFLKGMEVSHPQLANRLRRDVRAWDEMLAIDQKNSARMRRDGGIKFTGDDAEDFDFYRWAYGRGMTQSDTSFSGLLAAAGRGLWSVTKGAGKLAVTATKAAATDNAAAQMELAATAVDSAQSAVSEYQQLGAGIAAMTIGDDPQLKMAAMYELAKFSDEEQKNHNAWRKAISDSFAEVPVDEDSVNALSEAFDISNLIGAGTGKLVTRGIKRVGAGGVAEVLGKSRKMLGSELAAKAMSNVPVLGAPYKRAILAGQVEALSSETQLAFKELAESKSRLASLQGTLAQNPSWSLRDPMVKQIAAQEALVAEKQGAFDLINGQLNARRGEVTESLNLAGRGLLNRAAAGTLDVAGAAVENTGKTLTRARRGLSELLTGEADDQIVGGVADAATGGFASKGNVITRMGQDVRVAAATMKQNGASIPYFRRLNQDADATKLTRNAAAFMDKSHIAWALDKSKDLGLAGLAGAPLSGTFGYVASGGDLNAAAESAGGGMAFGIGGGAYGQWSAYKDPNYRFQELLANRRQFRDTLSSRETNGQSQMQIFDQLDAGEQLALASYAQGSPDVVFRLINEPGVASGLYDRENNVVVINRASKTPVEDIFRHEVAHFVERHGLEAQVREMYLGDAEKGVIGQYTEIDRLGNPAFDESTSPEGEKKYTYRINAEGQKLKAEYENKVRAFDPAFTMSNDYFASELFAEQYADRIFRGGLRRDLGRNAVDSVVDSLANVPLLKDFMGQIGLLFDQSDNVVGTGVFTGLKSNPEVNKLISRFNVDVSKGRAAKMQDAPDQHVLSEKELRDPVVATKWLQSGGSVRFGADGKPVYKKDGTPQFLTEKEAEAEQRDLANALIVEIEKYTAANIDDADMLQRRELTDINGRKSVVYTGRRIPMAVIDAIEAQKRFNPHQLAHLRAMSASVEKHGVGAMIAHFYQAASSKLGGKSYKTVGGRWRRDGIVGFQITKDGNVLTNSVSWEQLAENARKAAKTKLAREVYATSGVSIEAAITADVKQYLENLIDGKPGAESLGEDRRNFVNNLLGIRMASNVMLRDNGNGVLESANPLFETTDAPKTILTNLRLDRMNRVSPLDSVEYAWGPQQYRRAKMNLRPDAVEGEPVSDSGAITREVSDNIKFSNPPSDEEAINALSKDKKQYFGKARNLPEGTPVGLRIDIPAFENNDVYVVTVHNPATPSDVGDRIGYDTIVRVSDPKFFVKEGDETSKKGAQAIKEGRAKKHPIATVEGKFNPSREIPNDINDWTAVGFDPKDHSYFYDKTTDQPVIGGKQAISVGNTVFVKDPMYGDRSQFQYRPEAPQKRTVADREDSPQFRPETNPETEQIAAKYMKTRGVPYTPHTEYDATPESQLKRIADFFQNEAKHDPTNPEVRASYDALADETLAQYRAMERAGIKIEPFSGEGEPYKSSADMMADVRDNKHLFFFLTDKAFGEGEQPSENALTQKSGVRINGSELLFNDLFRAVHDYFGHTARGFEFGPRGEFNAWKSHSKMFSDEAQGALAAETLAQNAWVNFGPHMRNKDGAVPKKGEEGFISPQDRPFAEQKNFVLPSEYLQFRPEDDLGADKKAAKSKIPSYAKSATIVNESGTKFDNVSLKNGASSLTKVVLENNPQELFARLDLATEKIADDPLRMADPKGYAEFMRDAGVYGNILTAPPTLKVLLENPQEYVDNLLGGYHGDKTKPGTMEAADAGLDGTVRMREAIKGRPPEMVSALHHLWGILSRMLPPVEQESAWLRLVSRPQILEQIQRSIDGTYDLTQEQWKSLVKSSLKETNAIANGRGNQGTANANAFYAMLSRWNGQWSKVSDVYAVENSIQSGRAFWSLGHGAVGIKNKVQRFIGLTFGIPGLIMDRWKFVELYYPQFGKKASDYFDYSSTGTPEDPNGIYAEYGGIEGGNSVFSLAFYEGMETVLQRAIDQSPELKNVLGRHPNVGGLHWKGWNAIKNEAVGHSSLDLTYDLVKADPSAKIETVLKLFSEKEYYTEGLSGNRKVRFSIPVTSIK